MKAVLVIDMPNVCCSSKRNCDLCVEKDWGFICAKTGLDVLWGQKPDWCLLHPLPDKATPENSDMGISWNLGWNACLDVITGEAKT